MNNAPWRNWPRVAGHGAEALLAIQREFEASERLPPAELQQCQDEALGNLLRHAARQVPHYRTIFASVGFDPDKPLSEASWSRLPVLRRKDVRDLGAQLFAASYPSEFGATGVVASGGSTGVPVRVRKTAFEGQLWEAASLRDEIWHREDIAGRLLNMRGISGDLEAQLAGLPDASRLAGGMVLQSWGEPHSRLWKTGPIGLLQPGTSVAQQIEFMEAFAPDYLLLRPSSLRLLLSEYRAQGRKRPLRAVWTISETVDADLRAACAEVFQCRIVSNYSASETGYIALQCPGGSGYHALADIVRVEILDDAGQPVKQGERGRVVVTPLYAYAMPLIRYEIGDEAIAGGRCDCGRTLPHIAEIAGRLQNYFLLPDGTEVRADLSHYRLSAIPRIREFQLAQTSQDTVELRISAWGELDATEQAVVARVLKVIPPGLAVRVVYTESIARTAAGKLLQFVREFDPG